MRSWAVCGWLLQLHGHVHGSSQVTWYPEYPGESANSIEICNGGFGFSVIRLSNGLLLVHVGHGFQSPLPGIGSAEPVVGVAIGFDQIYYLKSIDDMECEIYRVTVTSPESLCAPHVRTTTPHSHVRTLPRIKSIAAGESHCAMVTHDGRVFQYGEKSPGEEVDIGCTVVHVCCGSHHTVALSTDGQVWTWGDSLRGQCGRGIRESAPGVVDFGPVKMRHIAAGSSFTLSCSDTGDVYSWGTNAEGALGQSSEGVSSAYEPMLVDFFGVDGRDVVKLAAGSSHALALTANGAVYGFGSNRFGQLGVGQHVTKTHTPIQVGLQKTCYDIAAGWWHSVFVTEA
ncbi:hypothetical protein M9435_005314 [Picochlorum sp. BPE23]|nr:hypothetical protein M9435_005314 [Picochlorum sp. BPE23]